MGLAMARRFAREEMNVVLSDIDESKLEAAVSEIRADGGNVPHCAERGHAAS